MTRLLEHVKSGMKIWNKSPNVLSMDSNGRCRSKFHWLSRRLHATTKWAHTNQKRNTRNQLRAGKQEKFQVATME